MFPISDVHPFTAGNGRIARVMMNAELVTRQQSEIIVSTGFRGDYTSALRRLSLDDDPTGNVKALCFLHDYTAQTDWTTNAFEEPHDVPGLRQLRPTSDMSAA